MTRLPPETHADFRSQAGDRWRVLGTAREIRLYAPLLEAARFQAVSPKANHDEPLGDDGLPKVRGVIPLDDYTRDDSPPPEYVQWFADLAEQLGGGVALRHPAFVVAHLGLPDLGRWAVTGYPGSGNVVLQRVLDELDLLRPPPPIDERAEVGAAWGRHHGRFLHRAVDTLLTDLSLSTGHEVEDFVIAPGNLGSCSLRATLVGGGSLFVNHLPYAGFVGHNYGAHIRWGDPAVRFFERFGFRRVYLVVRNPISVVASNAAKTVRPLENALHDPAWFQREAEKLAGYVEAALSCPEAYRVVRYEDLITQPRDTIGKLAADAGFEITDEDADTIWERVGFKSLTPAGEEHLFDPRADKRPYFREAHLPMMDAAALWPAFTAFGYDVPTADDLGVGELQPPPAADTTPSALYGRVDMRCQHEAVDHDLPLWVRADRPGVADWVMQRFREDWHCRLLAVLGNGFGGLTLPGRQTAAATGTSGA